MVLTFGPNLNGSGVPLVPNWMPCSGLPTGLPDFPSERYVQAVLKDKKKADGSIKMVFLKETGAVCLRPVEAPQLHEFFTYLLQPRTP